jgi:hypothetical protein
MNLNDTTSTAPKGNTSYLGRPGERIGYDVAGTGPLLVLVPGMGDLRAGYAPAEARLAQVTAPVLVVMGEQDPDFTDPAGEAGWIAQTMRAQVVMVPEAGHYPQSQRPDITTDAVLRFLATVHGRAFL